MCDHDGTTTGVLSLGDRRAGTLEPALLCDACGTIVKRLEQLEYRCTPRVPYTTDDTSPGRG
jgi:hypothetical protein